LINVEIIFDLPIGFPINNIFILSFTHTQTHTNTNTHAHTSGINDNVLEIKMRPRFRVIGDRTSVGQDTGETTLNII